MLPHLSSKRKFAGCGDFFLTRDSLVHPYKRVLARSCHQPHLGIEPPYHRFECRSVDIWSRPVRDQYDVIGRPWQSEIEGFEDLTGIRPGPFERPKSAALLVVDSSIEDDGKN